MDVPALKDAFERVSKKQKTTYTRTNETIDKLLQELQRTKQLLQLGQVSQASGFDSQGPLSALQAKVTEGGSTGPLAVVQKELTGALGKYGKLLDKSFCSDVAKACRDVHFDGGILDQVIAQHLFREGKFELGEKFVEEAQVPLPASLKEPFHEMYQILEQIRCQNLEPALQWVRQYRSKLQVTSTGALHFEFKLHQLHYMHLLQKRGRQAALQYARANFGPFATTHMHDIQRLMGCLLWAGRIESSPYKDLVADTRWEDIGNELTRECCNMLGQSYESPLYTTITAGATALPTLLKLASVMASKRQDWNLCKQLPVEIELGREFHFHSIFACPVSRDQSTADNPPMLMPCGHVLCKQSIQKLAKGNSRSFKCPYCPMEATVQQCRQVFF